MATRKKTAKATAAKKNGDTKEIGVLRRPFLISVGAFALAEEQASSMIDSLIERGEKARKAGEKYMKKLNKNVSKVQEDEKLEEESTVRRGSVRTRARMAEHSDAQGDREAQQESRRIDEEGRLIQDGYERLCSPFQSLRK